MLGLGSLRRRFPAERLNAELELLDLTLQLLVLGRDLVGAGEGNPLVAFDLEVARFGLGCSYEVGADYVAVSARSPISVDPPLGDLVDVVYFALNSAINAATFSALRSSMAAGRCGALPWRTYRWG
jgi:hypothetical protein